MPDWNKNIIANLNEELRGTREKDLRFFRIEEYLRMVNRVGEFSQTCSECKQFQPQIEEQLESIKQAIHTPGKGRRQYDRHLDRLARHMKKGHSFYPPYYFTYSYSFFFTLILTSFSFLISLIFPSVSAWYFVVPGFILGLLAGQLYGAKKDGKVRATKKIL